MQFANYSNLTFLITIKPEFEIIKNYETEFEFQITLLVQI